MKIAIVVPAAFMIGLVGGTLALRGHGAAPEAAKKETEGETGSQAKESAPAAVDTSTKAPETAPSSGAAKPDSTINSAKVDSGAAPGKTADARRMAGIVSKLSVEDALLLVRGMDDQELVAVLYSMDVAHAGPLLAGLPAPRNAVITKLMAKSPTPGKP